MGVWHTYSTRQTLSELETDKSRGLSGAEAERRLARWGPNRLEEGRRQGLLLRFLGQMKDPMILVLLAAAALSLWASGGEDWLDAAIILVIVVVNACISISQEDSAEKALEALRKMSAPLAKVVRDGALQRLETDRLVPGDIIHLEAGDLVPADARILEAASLQADESAMTGESVPVSKGLLSALPEDTPLAERHNMVLASTVITRGRAVCVVTGTGMDTEVGRIAGLLLGEGEGQTPLQKKMAEISKTLSFVCLCVCAVMFGVGLLQGRPMLDMFLTAVSLAVAAIPEGLPAIVTIVLALGVARMARRRAIVKRLPAVETLGCAGVICSDKTVQKLSDDLKAEVVDLQQQKETAQEELRRAKKEIQTEKLKGAATTAAANIAESVGSLFGSNKVKTLERENTALHKEVADHEETIEALQDRIQTMQADHSREIREMQQKHGREIADKDTRHKQEISFLKTVIARAAAWFPYFREMLRIENLCRLVGFDERQTATLVKGKPLEYAGELYSEEHGRKFTTERAGFQVLKDPTDGTKLVLAIDRKPIAEWFKEQFEKLRQNIRRPIQPQRKGKGFKL